MDPFMAEAIAEARRGGEAGGFPIGSVLVKDGRILGRGRNTLYQAGDPTGHAEMEAFRDAARAAAADHAPEALDALWRDGTVYTTMMPCAMCAGAMIRFRIARVVVGETATYADSGTRPLMERQGIEVADLHLPECIALVRSYLRSHPERGAGLTSSPARRIEL